MSYFGNIFFIFFWDILNEIGIEKGIGNVCVKTEPRTVVGEVCEAQA